MARRVHVESVALGRVVLPAGEAHHLRDVLRLGVGDSVEVFDDAGNVGYGTLARVTGGEVVVEVTQIQERAEGGLRLSIASAVPKGNRADWMVEKLSELGVDVFIPLATARSVVLPEGKNKLERWERIASEAAKQSKRAGVMRVGELTDLRSAIEEMTMGWVLSTRPGSMAMGKRMSEMAGGELTLFVGPEGGWTGEELEAFVERGIEAVSVGTSILRVETAAVAAAAVVRAWG